MNKAKPAKPPKRVTLKDIAAHCGVCAMTVSCALRGDRKMVSQKTIETIRQVAREMGYRSDLGHAARRLKYTHAETPVINHLVGMDINLDAIDSPYFTRLLGAICKVFYEEDFALLTGWSGKSRHDRLPLVFRRGDVDGVFNVAGVQGSDRILGLLRDEPGFGRRPVVSVLEPLADCPAVLTDDEAGGQAIAAHVHALGHRGLLYSVPACGSTPGKRRLAGMHNWCVDHGLDPQQFMIPLAYDSHAGAAAFLAAWQQARQQTPQATAIFAGNDLNAVAICAALRDQGMRVPDDLSVIGYDDTHTVPDPSGNNLLTTVRLPLEDVGTRAAQMLIRLIRGETVNPTVVSLPVHLVVRSSVRQLP